MRFAPTLRFGIIYATLLLTEQGASLLRASDPYLSKVGPASMRLALIPTTSLPSVGFLSNPRPRDKQVSEDSDAFIGPRLSRKDDPHHVPLPQIPTLPESSIAPLGPTTSGDPIVLSSERSAPVRPSEIRIADSSNGAPITAQMMLRYFHPSIPSEELNRFGTNSVPGSTQGKPVSGSETAVWLPIQFVPPEPFTPTRSESSSSYEEVTPSVAQPPHPKQP